MSNNRLDRESSFAYTASNELYENKILINSDGSNLVLNILRVSFFFCLNYFFIYFITVQD